jgi:hypothetical protein
LSFEYILGATRLRDGTVIVADRGPYAVSVLSPAGRLLKQFGRRGSGPGEVRRLRGFLRCGDTLVTLDADADRTTLFRLDGSFIRQFRFGAPEAGRTPYRTVCNNAGVFAHYAWETIRDGRAGVYRPQVPFWVTTANAKVVATLGTFPGSERYGLVTDNVFRAARPLPLGRESEIAIGDSTVFVGLADRYEVLAFTLAGRPAGQIRRDVPEMRVTRADVDNAKARDFTLSGAMWHSTIERDYEAMQIPPMLPPYRSLQVDAAGLLWVQSYPRRSEDMVLWRVFSARGTALAEVAVPANLEVFEIGVSYLLGRYVDRRTSIPELRMYALRRGDVK